MPHKDPNVKKKYLKQWRKDNVDKIRQYRIANRERHNFLERLKRKKNPERYKGYDKAKYKRDRNIILKRAKRYYQENKEEGRLKRREYFFKNKEKIKALSKKYNQEHREERKKYSKMYRQNNKEKIKVNNRIYQKKKRKEDPQFRIKSRLKAMLSIAFKRYNGKGRKLYSSKRYGIDYKAIIKHLEPFPKDLSAYHIDHIRPLCSFNFNDPEQIKEAFAPDNHQWLLAKDNLSKGGKWNG